MPWRPPSRRPVSDRAARTLVSLLAVAAVAVLSPVSALASGSTTRTVTQDGLTATPTNAQTGQPVRFVARARTQHATGALVYGLTYGDGTSARPVAVPQYCLAGSGRPAAGTWHFTHQYSAPGRYQVRLQMGVNCGGEHASLQIAVNVAA
jgi:hypothetical protein